MLTGRKGSRTRQRELRRVLGKIVTKAIVGNIESSTI